MEFYISQIIEGIAAGTVYGLLGLSMMFIYRSNRIFNFAQGEMATAVAFMASVVIKLGHPWLAVPVALAFAFVFGVALEVLVLERVRERNELSAVIVTLGIYAIINSVNCWLFGYEPYAFPTPFPEGNLNWLGIFISYQSIGILCCTLLISVSLFLFFKFTVLGTAFQAMAEDPLAARLIGLRVGFLVAVAWGISVMLGGVAGMLAAHSLYLHPNTMGTVLLYSLAASVIGGLQTSFGALVGGILVGVIENLAGTVSFIGPELKTAVVFFILVFFLMARPRGLFGRDEPRRI